MRLAQADRLYAAPSKRQSKEGLITGGGRNRGVGSLSEMIYGKTGFIWRAAPAIVDDNSHYNEELLRAEDQRGLSDLHAQLLSRWRLPFSAIRSPMPVRRLSRPSGMLPSGRCGSLSSSPISAG